MPAGNRAPRRFVTRPQLQLPRSAAMPYPRPRNAGRSGSYANTVYGSKLATSMPSSPRRRERLRDRSKQPRGSCCADQANLARWYTAAKAATMPTRRGRHFVRVTDSPRARDGGQTRRSCMLATLPEMLGRHCRAANAAARRRRPHRPLSQAQKCRRNALTNESIPGLKSEGARTM